MFRQDNLLPQERSVLEIILEIIHDNPTTGEGPATLYKRRERERERERKSYYTGGPGQSIIEMTNLPIDDCI